MAAEIKVTEAAVEAAIKAMVDSHGFLNPATPRYVRAALEAGLAAMLEPVGWVSGTQRMDAQGTSCSVTEKPWRTTAIMSSSDTH